ncbi:hypothetical protein C8A03DRAFT_18516 [Achaetomium macrosporum]|uniref:Zn(2)-C6 fungal-type domain-containing protein n=1 Tax=Achaetomium macrosporum TaxID=79813 RepID=A0AAN7H8Q0_9PEZI|nr:hypothetical protein C8A03DRAFT_18516 [Achaetomium macrosporum]
MLLSRPNAPVGPPSRLHRKVSLSTRRILWSTRPKLRQSCQTCAGSKVKCPREKPSCSRCESRGITCEYVFTKRPGRKRANSTANSVNNIKSTSSSEPSCSSGSTSSSAIDVGIHWSRDEDTTHALHLAFGHNLVPESTISPKHSDMSPISPSMPTTPGPPDNIPAADASDDLFSVPGASNMCSDLEYLPSELCGAMDFAPSTLESLSGLSMQGSGVCNAALIQSDPTTLLPPFDAASHGFVAPEAWWGAHLWMHQRSGPTPQPSNTAHVPPAAGSPDAATPSYATNDTSTACSCLGRALDLLERLSLSNKPPGSVATVDSASVCVVRAVLQENRHGIEAIESMLACSSCTRDGFLLTVLAMAVLKILERYDAASQCQPAPERGTRTAERQEREASEDKPAVNDSSGRRCMAAAQLVLSELYRAQRVVNKLSPRLKAPAIVESSRSRDSVDDGVSVASDGLQKGAIPKGGDCSSSSSVQLMAAPAPAPSPFSAATLAGVESDLRKNLGSLSAGIIESLRQR